MKIDFFEIPEDGLSFSFSTPEWVPEDFILRGDVSASLFMKRFSERIIATGEFQVTVILTCDRCLEEFSCPLDSKFKVDIELPRDDSEFAWPDDHHCSENEMDVLVLDGDKIDIFHLLSQQLYLTVPMKNICSEGCKGICTKCGANLNSENCACVNETDSPFAQLANLKTKRKQK